MRVSREIGNRLAKGLVGFIAGVMDECISIFASGHRGICRPVACGRIGCAVWSPISQTSKTRIPGLGMMILGLVVR